MLKKKNRIGNEKAISTLFAKGKLFKSQFLVFKYEKTMGGPSQFAISVSKKIFKRANKRNHLNRQIQEALRLSLPYLKQNMKILVIARPHSQKATFQEISQSINTFFNLIGPNE